MPQSHLNLKEKNLKKICIITDGFKMFFFFSFVDCYRDSLSGNKARAMLLFFYDLSWKEDRGRAGDNAGHQTRVGH